MRQVGVRVGVLLVAALGMTTTVRSGYDFEPVGFRAAARFLGIGPGPGYHAPPCDPRNARFHQCVTRGYAAYPQEPDYYPRLFSEEPYWSSPSLLGSEYGHPVWPVSPSFHHPEAPRSDSPKPEHLPRPSENVEPRPRTLPRTQEGPNLDEWRNEPGEGPQGLFKELQPPSPSDQPEASSSARRSQKNDRRNATWW